MPIVIIGAGTHCGVVVDAIRLEGKQEIEGLLDDTLPNGTMRHGVMVLGKVKDAYYHRKCDIFVAIGDNAGRRSVVDMLRGSNLNYVNVIHPGSKLYQNPSCTGSYFGVGCHVGTKTTIGNFSILNTLASLDHDSKMGDFSHMAPGSMTGGRVTIGSDCMIGIGACIRDGVSIGNRTTIGMGSVVTMGFSPNVLAYGNPARIIREI